jgi:hypothetical protein
VGRRKTEGDMEGKRRKREREGEGREGPTCILLGWFFPKSHIET